MAVAPHDPVRVGSVLFACRRVASRPCTSSKLSYTRISAARASLPCDFYHEMCQRASTLAAALEGATCYTAAHTCVYPTDRERRGASHARVRHHGAL
jgi:hypothetical protein